MLIEKPELHRMAAQAIAELATEGRAVAPQDVLWLHHLAEKVSAPYGKRGPIDWVAPPIQCGGVTLYELTLAGEWWLFECAAKWWHGNSRLEILACAWVMAEGRTNDALQRVADERAAWWVLREWQKTCHASLEMLDAATLAMIDAQPMVNIGADTKPSNAPADWAGIAQTLVEHYGETADYWIFRAPVARVNACISQIVAANTGKDSKDTHLQDAKRRAFAAFSAAVSDIRSRANG
jgi:hypothetical protein